MADTSSEILPLGTPMPEFHLPDTVSGRTVASSECAGRVAVVSFICNHCPFVKHIRSGLAAFGRWCNEHDVPLIAISSNDSQRYPADAPPAMQEEARSAGYAFPYVFDESQDVAKAFRAVCTPEFYVFDRNGALAYRGQFDDSRPKNDVPVTGNDVRQAVVALLEGRRPNGEQKPAIGCTIKWKA
jgi:thiol-disulfide isomerase/thioredoxin